MAVNPVSLAESLRPWRDAGVGCLLFPEDDPLLVSVRETQNRQAPPLRRDAAPQNRPSAGPARPASAQSRTEGTAAQHSVQYATGYIAGQISEAADGLRSETGLKREGPNAAAPSASPQKDGAGTHAPHTRNEALGATSARYGGRTSPPGGTAPDAASGPAPARPGTVTAPSATEIVRSWPPRWQEIWQRCRPAPLLWTYAELGADLSGSGSPERSALLRRLMSELAFPKGSSVFWPFRLPEDSESAQPARDEPPFSQGLRLLAPQVLICCGSSAASRVPALEALSQPFTQSLHKGMLALLLPDLAAMAAEEKTYQQTLAFLRGALADLAVLRPRKGQ